MTSLSRALPGAAVTKGCRPQGKVTRGLHLLIGEWQGGRGNSAAATFGKCSLLQSPDQSLVYGMGGKPRDSGNSGILVGPLA